MTYGVGCAGGYLDENLEGKGRNMFLARNYAPF